LVTLVEKYTEKDSSILEVGCREGNNLISLFQAGFTRLVGLESNPAKVAGFKNRHTKIAKRIDVITGPIEELVRGLEDSTFSLVLTVGFLFDNDRDHTWLFPELVRLTSHFLISIEDERAGSLKGVYERLGLKEVETKNVSAMKELDSVFFGRVFKKVGSF
jgi:Methyltransferase domain